MGNILCQACETGNFQVTRQCADQFLNDDNEILASEQRWITKLKCLDDAHSRKLGLSPEAFNEYADRLEKIILARKVPVYCKNKALLLTCLERNQNCMLNCTREMNEFIECVDTLRIRRIKERIQESLKKNKRYSYD